jgi:nucleoid-associated protein YgaU
VIGILRTVVKGDTLWDIAQTVYGDATRWPEIYAANTDVIGADPDLIFPGQVLRIP